MSSSGLKRHLCAFIYHPQNILLFWEVWHIVYQILCSNTLRRKNLKVYGSLKENKLTYFTNSKGSFQGLNLVCGIRKKSYTYDSTRCKFLYLGGARMYQKVSANKAYKKIVYQNFQFFQPLKITFMCTCDFCRCEHVQRNFRTFLEENCAIAFDSCHLFTKKMLNIKLTWYWYCL